MKKVEKVNKDMMNKIKNHLDSLMKPLGSLGILEELAIQIGGITGNFYNPINKSCHVVFASDNGVEKEGVSSCPREYTRIVSESILSGHGAISSLCQSNSIDLFLVDIGIDGDIKRIYKRLINKKVRKGTGNIKIESAMKDEEMRKALQIGVDIAIKLSKDYNLLSCGEMGIANTTTSSALISALLKKELEIGYGAGLTESGLSLKKTVINEALKRVKDIKDPLDLLKELGGFDIAGMVGFYIGAAYSRTPIVLDGFISSAAALCAYKLYPVIKDYFICAHNSEEPGMKEVLKEMNLKPMINTQMRMGEGTGAVLAHAIIKSANSILKNMKTENEIYNLLK